MMLLQARWKESAVGEPEELELDLATNGPIKLCLKAVLQGCCIRGLAHFGASLRGQDTELDGPLTEQKVVPWAFEYRSKPDLYKD
jgi:hypothetical protein